VISPDSNLYAGECLLLSKSPLQEPAYNREVLPLIVGWEDDGVFVALRSHFDLCG
jgi:hypothetical protein